MEVLRRQLVGLLGALLLLGPLATAAAMLFELHAGAVRQHLEGLGEVDRLGFHDEVEEVSPLAATKAVPELLLAADREARRLLGVEGAEADELLALPVQPDVPGDHLDYVEAVLHLLLGVP